MNERIKELAEQCYVTGTARPHGWSAWSRIDEQKFAELIVRECMTMSDDLKAKYLSHRKGTTDFSEKNIYAEGEAACDILRYKIKQHFGIEE